MSPTCHPREGGDSSRLGSDEPDMSSYARRAPLFHLYAGVEGARHALCRGDQQSGATAGGAQRRRGRCLHPTTQRASAGLVRTAQRNRARHRAGKSDQEMAATVENSFARTQQPTLGGPGLRGGGFETDIGLAARWVPAFAGMTMGSNFLMGRLPADESSLNGGRWCHFAAAANVIPAKAGNHFSFLGGYWV